jgi:hypothetical protein
MRGKGEKGMSLTCYAYEEEMAGFADELEQAIAAVIQGTAVTGKLSVKHRTFQGKPAMVHEQCWNKPPHQAEQIAYGYYLEYVSPSNTKVDFWVGKILYKNIKPTGKAVSIGLWADGNNQAYFPQVGGGSYTVHPLGTSPECFWELAGKPPRLPPYDSSVSVACPIVSPVNPNPNATANIKILETFLNDVLSKVK